MSGTSPLPVLWSFRRCPYAIRARLALTIAGRACELREVSLRDKPPEMLKASQKGTVPVLELPCGRVIDESLDIMQWALRQSGTLALLHDPRGEGAALIARNDSDFKRHLDRYKYPGRYEDADPDRHHALALDNLIDLDRRISHHGNLVSSAETLADLAVFPFVRQFAGVDPDRFESLELPGLQAWLQRQAGHPRFAAIMHKHPFWRPDSVPLVFSPKTDNNASPAAPRSSVGV